MEIESRKKEPSGQSLYETLQMVSSQKTLQFSPAQSIAFDVLVKCGFVVWSQDKYLITADARRYMTDFENQEKLKLRIPFKGTRQKYFTYAGVIFLFAYMIFANYYLRRPNRSFNSNWYMFMLMIMFVGIIGFANIRWLYLLNMAYTLLIFISATYFFYNFYRNPFMQTIPILGAISLELTGGVLILTGGCIAIFRKQYRLVK